MDLSFYPLTLEALDQAQAESLCLFVGEDERPLRGLAGLVDWRLSGALSRHLRSGFVTGRQGDALLTLPGPKLPFQKLFIFGMGLSGQTEDELAERLSDGLARLGAAGAVSAAFDLPQGLSLDVGVRTLVFAKEGPAKALVFGSDPGQLVTALAHAAARGVEAPVVVERRVVKVPGPPPPRPIGAPTSSSPTVKPVPGPQTYKPPESTRPLPGSKKKRR